MSASRCRHWSFGGHTSQYRKPARGQRDGRGDAVYLVEADQVVGPGGAQEGQERLVGRPHVDGVAAGAEGHARVPVGIDMEPVETDAVGGFAVRLGEMALPVRTGRVGQLDHVEETLRAAIVAHQEQLGMIGGER